MTVLHSWLVLHRWFITYGWSVCHLWLIFVALSFVHGQTSIDGRGPVGRAPTRSPAAPRSLGPAAGAHRPADPCRGGVRDRDLRSTPAPRRRVDASSASGRTEPIRPWRSAAGRPHQPGRPAQRLRSRKFDQAPALATRPPPPYGQPHPRGDSPTR